MPITRSAKKALRVSARKKVVNDRRAKAMKDSSKALKKLIASKKTKEAREYFATAQQAIDKAAKKGIIKKGAASRKKSRLSAMMKKAA